jgi:hypothetical protein
MSDIIRLFEGKVELTNETKNDITALWEAKLNERVEHIISNIEKDIHEEIREDMNSLYESKVEEYINEEVLPFYEQKTQEYIDNIIFPEINEYISESVKEFIADNSSKLKNVAIAEAESTVLHQIRSVFENLSIKVPQSKVNEYSIMQDRVQLLESKCDELIDTNRNLNNHIHAMKLQKVVSEATVLMSDIEKERFMRMVEDFDASDLDSFKKQVKFLAEAVKKNTNDDDDDDENDDDEMLNETINDPWLVNLVKTSKIIKG